MVLACYATSETNSLGRERYEEPASYRNEFQRDRDRIVHSSAFRRLEYKTQVFLNHVGDMFRTRLTHSIEVSQIGRTISRALHLNEDLTEAVCLAHDLGHTPFGHAGQDQLNQCMREFGGFEHNLQSLRVVDVLEDQYAEFSGLNLMYETREGILKHCSRARAISLGSIGQRFLDRQQPCLEAQVADIADQIAYNSHDVDDGLRSGLITFPQLDSCALFTKEHAWVLQRWPNLSEKSMAHEIKRRMITYLVEDVISTSQVNFALLDPLTIGDIRQAESSLICFSDAVQSQKKELNKFLYKNLYQHPTVQHMNREATNVICYLFDQFMSKSNLLPQAIHKKILLDGSESGKAVMISDYIAGMTDRFAFAEFERIKK